MVVGDVLTGWIRLPSEPGTKLEVALEKDGVEVARTRAVISRPDLAAFGMPEPDCGFSFALGSLDGGLLVRVVDEDWVVGELAATVPAVSPATAAPAILNDRVAIQMQVEAQQALHENVKSAHATLLDVRRLLSLSVFGRSSLDAAVAPPGTPAVRS